VKIARPDKRDRFSSHNTMVLAGAFTAAQAVWERLIPKLWGLRSRVKRQLPAQ
jgi:hypothetical protein